MTWFMEKKNSTVAKFSKQAGNQQSSAVYLALYNILLPTVTLVIAISLRQISLALCLIKKSFKKKWQSN